MSRVADELLVFGNPRSGKRGSISREAFGGGVDAGAVAEEPDAAVALQDQVRDRALGASAIVAEDAIGIDRHRRTVDEGQREAGSDVSQQ